MRAGLFSAIGEGYLFHHEISRAIEYFEKSLSAAEVSVAHSKVPTSDKRSLFATKAMLAQAYCMSGDYNRGLREYALVIEQEIQHVGNLHANLLQKYANYGVCASEGGNNGLAKDAFSKAVAICKQSDSDFGDVCHTARARLAAIPHHIEL